MPAPGSAPIVEIDPDVAEPPLLAFVRDYWQRRRGARAMPGRADIAPADMKAHLRHILLADVVDGGADFRYRLVGTELQRYFAGNPTGSLMSEILAPFGEEAVRQTLAAYRMTVERRGPLRVRGAGSLFDQGPKFVDALLTPLSDDGLSVNMILGTFMFVWDIAGHFPHTAPIEAGEAELARALRAGG